MSAARTTSKGRGAYSRTSLPFDPQRRKNPERHVRYTVDMDEEQHKFIKLFAIHNEISISTVMRAVAYLLESRLDLAQMVVDTIYLGRSVLTSKKNERAIRCTIDIQGSQHTFLKLFATHNNVRVSAVIRTLVYLLETRLDFAVLVIDLIFDNEEIDIAEGEPIQEDEEPAEVTDENLITLWKEGEEIE